MHLTLQKTIYRLSKYFLYGFIAQLLVFNFVLATNVNGQYKSIDQVQVRIDEESVTLGQFFKIIEKQTPFTFLYDSERINFDTEVTFTKNVGSVESYLAQISYQSNLRFRQVNNGIDVKVGPQSPEDTNSDKAEDVVVSGTVLDETGTPIPGVTIIVKGTTNGTVSDVDGKFSIDAQEGSVLVFSFIGFEKEEITIGSQTQLTVTMSEDLSQLEEVVVVGYGVQSKANLAGAVSTISPDAVQNRPITNLASGLQGVSPGLIINRTTGQPGKEGINIVIRGATSANGNVDPLIILDGVTVPSSVMTSLNPNDVESISVLKDASAAIYGAQAAGGVILITTKKGTDQKMQVDFTTMVGAGKVINMPDRMSLLDEALFNNLAFTNAGSNAPYNERDLDNIRNNVPYIVNPNDTTRYIYYNQVPATDVLLKDYSLTQNYNLSLRGGTEKISYFLSGGAVLQNGILKYGPDEAKRYNGRMNVGVELNKYVSLDTRLDFTHKEANAPFNSASGDYSIIYEISRLRTRNPQLTPEGRYNSSASTLAKLKEGGFDREAENSLGAVGTIRVGNFVDGLTFRGVFGINYRRDDDKRFGRTVPLWGRYAIENYVNPNNSVSVVQEIRKTTNIQYLVDYVKVFAERHSVTALVGYQYEDYRYEGIVAGAQNLTSNDLPALSLGNDLTKTNSESVATNAYQSLFGRINYVYNGKYIAEATYRYDENSKLAPSLRKQGFFGASVGWNVHEENWFYSALPFFSEFKVRGSWGKLGGALGDNIGNYGYISLMNEGSSLVLGNSRSTYYWQGSVASSSLTWETIETANIGLDLGFFGDKVRLTGEYFTKYNRDMLTTQELPAVFGIATPRKNIGELKSWGWELEASYRDRFTNGINFNMGFNLSDNQNELISYSGAKVVKAGLNPRIEGQPLKSFYGYQTDGYYTTQDEVEAGPFYSNKTGVGDVKYIDQDGNDKLNQGDGLIESRGDLIYLGTDAPRYSFGVTLGLDYKGFDLYMFVQGVGKRNFMPGYHSLAPLSQSWRQPLQYHADYWTPENPDALYPRPFYQGGHNYAVSDKWVFDAAYARLKKFR